MGCNHSKTKVSISKFNYFPVKNPYLVHYINKAIPLLGTYNFNSKIYSENTLKIPKLYSGCSLCWIDRDHLILGGGLFQTTTEILEIYIINILTLSAARLPNLITSHADFCLIYHCGEVYAISGYNYKNLLSPIVEKYDLKTVWKMCASLSIPRSYATPVSINNKLYVLGGNTGYKTESLTNIIEEYDNLVDCWTTLTIVLPLQFWKLGACKLSEERVLFFGGDNIKTHSYLSFELNFATMKYSEKMRLPENKDGWLFIFEAKNYKDVIYAIESKFFYILIYENGSWRVQMLKPEFMNNRV